MKEDKSPEMIHCEEVTQDRREALESWVRRQEHEQKIETIVNRLKKIIKGYDEHHMLIGLTVGERAPATSFFIFLIGWIIIWQLVPITPVIRILFSVFGVLGVLGTLRSLMGMQIIIDKTTQTIKIRERSLFLTVRLRVIPFFDILSVGIYHKEPNSAGWHWFGTDSRKDVWKVTLNTRYTEVTICYRTNRQDMFYLANEISKFIGSQLVDCS